jgi:hypothetical protein
VLEGWKCDNCKFDNNDILTSYCRICNAYKPLWLNDYCQGLAEIRRGIFIARIESYEHINRIECNEMTPQEELFQKFYNQEKILVKDMDVSMLREHRDELATIAFEAKARLVATDDESRERNAKSKNKEWLVTADSSQVNSDSLNIVKTRQARLSKMDKLKSQLLTAGIDEATVNEMVKNLERKATEKDVKAITFNKPTTEQAVIVVESKKPESNGELFNPLSLFGK